MPQPTSVPRKLRKWCSLPTCSRTPGECMHCTCDGRCGQHAPGLCGVRREGSGKGCKREDCPHDDSCFHSTRATCCHCRNLVSTNSRGSRKRNRPVHVLASPTSCCDPQITAGELPPPLALDDPIDLVLPMGTLLDDSDHELHKRPRNVSEPASFPKSLVSSAPVPIPVDQLLSDDDDLSPESDPDTGNQDGTTGNQVQLPPLPAGVHPRKALCEYPEWITRRNTWNLIVVVEGTQFNLHKSPMLLESQLLNAKARAQATAAQPVLVPVIELPVFPGGARAFDALCVYAYTGELEFKDLPSFVALYAGIHYLNMGLTARQKAQSRLMQLTSASTPLPLLVELTRLASLLADAYHLGACDDLLATCVTAIATHAPLTIAAMQVLLTLPNELFVHAVQELVNSRSLELVDDMVSQLCLQAELAQCHQESQGGEPRAKECLALVTEALKEPTGDLSSLPMPTPSPTTQENDADEALFTSLLVDFDLGPPSMSTSTSTSGGLLLCDLERLGDAFTATSLESFASRGTLGNALAEPFAV